MSNRDCHFQRGEEIWLVSSLLSGGGPREVRVSGNPQVVEGLNGCGAVAFDGQHDAIYVQGNPLIGVAQFAVEMIFEVAPFGPAEQRVLHVHVNGSSDRLLLETRGSFPVGAFWYADTIVCTGNEQAILADPTRSHPAGVWQTLAVVCDGQVMRQYVNGLEEACGPLRTFPWADGEVCLGMRANAVTPFRGRIAAVRFSRWARAVEDLWGLAEGVSREIARPVEVSR